MRKKKLYEQVEALRLLEEERRRILATANMHSAPEEDRDQVRVAYGRRNRDLNPQLVCPAKDEQNLSDFRVQAPPHYPREIER